MSTENIEVVTETPPIEAPPIAPDPAAELRAELARERQARIESDNRLKLKDEEALRKSKNWEELAKIKEQEAASANQKLEIYQQSILMDKKISALRMECMKLGITAGGLEDLEYMVDSLNISVESTSTGKILVHGADSAAQLLKAKRPHWFTSRPANVNSAVPNVVPQAESAMSLDGLKKLEAEMKKNPTRENQEKYKQAIIQFKTGKA